MGIARVVRSSLSLVLLFVGSAALGATAPPTKLILAARALDVRTGRYVPNAGVLVRGERIEAVGSAAKLRARAPQAPTIAAQDRGIEAALGDPQRRDRSLALREAIRSTVANARQLGVKVALGFDAAEAAYQGHSADELKSMVKYGFTPLEALQAATLGGAELYGDKIGAIEPGDYADLIAVEGDPLTDLDTLTRVSFVMKGGEVIKNDP